MPHPAGAVGGNRVLAAPSSLCEGQDRPPDALTASLSSKPAGKALMRPPAEGPSACQGGGEVLPPHLPRATFPVNDLPIALNWALLPDFPVNDPWMPRATSSRRQEA